MCSEKPRKWHRCINVLLFEYREAPQESTQFAPFELLYGHTVHGSMCVLKEVWTKELEQDKVKTSYQYVPDLRNTKDWNEH